MNWLLKVTNKGERTWINSCTDEKKNAVKNSKDKVNSETNKICMIKIALLMKLCTFFSRFRADCSCSEALQQRRTTHADVGKLIIANLSRLGAQTMAKFLACMLVSAEYEATLTRWHMRNSRVLIKRRWRLTEIWLPHVCYRDIHRILLDTFNASWYTTKSHKT